MFNIEDFKSNIKILRPNMFMAEIVIPSIVTNDLSGTRSEYQNKFKFRCESTDLPGRTIATTEDQTFGPTIRFPYEVVYNDIQLTIIASEDMSEKKFFEKWMDKIISPTDLNNSNFKGGIVQYYDSYAKGQLKISLTKDDNTNAMTTTCYDCYPIGIGPMTLAWSESDTYQRFSVTLAYRYYVNTY